MKSMKSMLGWLVCLFSAALMMAPPSPAGETTPMTVGRIFHIEGDLLRYVPEEKDWVAVVMDAPFGVEDTLFSGSNGMAEMIVPNGIWIRTGNSTQIQFIKLDTDLAEMDVASGMTRFYSKDQTTIKVTSPFGYVLADPGTIFDLYVGENSIEVVGIKGTVSFVHQTTDNRYDVAAGATSILADLQQVSLGDGTVDPDWNRWNMDRENFWLAKGEVKGTSVEYLPPGLRNEAYTFEENGKWERVPYENEERWFWRPTTVAVGWSPFTMGRWTDWHEEQTWIPAEPFGYTTHHYGNWIYTNHYWYWAPPVVSVRIGMPMLDIGFFWFPGRVSWIQRGIYVGWIPLAPRETYYSHRHWGGPHTVVVNDVNIHQINSGIRNYAYASRAIIIPQDRLYGVKHYRNVRVINISRTTIINNYRATPVINVMIKNYATIKQRHNYTNRMVKEKPHYAATNRIQHNETMVREGRKENVVVLKDRMKSIPEGKVNSEVRIEPPKSTNYVVPAKEANRPKSEMRLPQREIKRSGKVVPQLQPFQATQPSSVAERVRTEKPADSGQSPVPSKRVIPPGSSQSDRERPLPVTPARPGLQEKRPPQAVHPTPRPERDIPAKPAQLGQPPAPSERMTPARPTQPDRERRERTTPEKTQPPENKPAQPEQSRTRPQRVSPAEPAQPGRSNVRPAPMVPAKPAHPEQARPERIVQEKQDRQKIPLQPEQSSPAPERVRSEKNTQSGQRNMSGKSEPKPKGPIRARAEDVVPEKADQTGKSVQPVGTERPKMQKGAK